MKQNITLSLDSDVIRKAKILAAQRQMTGKQVIKILEKEGWQLLRISGSHHRMIKGNKKVSIPVHGAKDLKIRTLKSIERDTGVKLI
jgi:predicted RNA binding protein YcfA (HicA-like mRNA interferase family)